MPQEPLVQFNVHPHALRRMGLRGITNEDIACILLNFDTSRLAQQLPHLDFRSEILSGVVRGRRLRLYVMQGSGPPYIMTVAWEKR